MTQLPLDINRNRIEKSLIGVEDLLLGFGTVIQNRFGVDVEITKINPAELKVDGINTLGDYIQYLKENKEFFEASAGQGSNQITLMEALGEVADELLEVLGDASDLRPDSFFKRYVNTITRDQYVSNEFNNLTLGDTYIDNNVDIRLDYMPRTFTMDVDSFGFSGGTVLQATRVGHDVSQNTLTAGTVQGAINELDERMESGAGVTTPLSTEVMRPDGEGEPSTESVEDALLDLEAGGGGGGGVVGIPVGTFGNFESDVWLTLDSGLYVMDGIPSNFKNSPLPPDIHASIHITCLVDLLVDPTTGKAKQEVEFFFEGGTYMPPVLAMRGGEMDLTSLIHRQWTRIDSSRCVLGLGSDNVGYNPSFDTWTNGASVAVGYSSQTHGNVRSLVAGSGIDIGDFGKSEESTTVMGSVNPTMIGGWKGTSQIGRSSIFGSGCGITHRNLSTTQLDDINYSQFVHVIGGYNSRVYNETSNTTQKVTMWGKDNNVIISPYASNPNGLHVAYGDNITGIAGNHTVFGESIHTYDGESIVIGRGITTDGDHVLMGTGLYASGSSFAPPPEHALHIGINYMYDIPVASDSAIFGNNAVTSNGIIIMGHSSGIYMEGQTDATILGHRSIASHNSVAIGNDVVASSNNSIVLGNSSHTVLLGNGATVTSDRRDKVDVEELPKTALNIIKAMSPKQYRYNNRDRYSEPEKTAIYKTNHKLMRAKALERKYPKSKIKIDMDKLAPVYPVDVIDVSEEKKDPYISYGVIAQDVLTVFNSHGLDSDGLVKEVEGLKGGELKLDYTQLIPFLIGAIQELTQEVEELKSKVGGV